MAVVRIEMSQEEKERVVLAIQKKIPSLKCPMCAHTNFVLVEGYLPQSLSAKPASVNLGGSIIPSVGIICTHCGFLSQHALGPLGIMENPSSHGDIEKLTGKAP